VAVIVLGSTTMVAANGAPARSLYREFTVLKAHPTGPDGQPGSALIAGRISALRSLLGPKRRTGTDGLTASTVVTLIADAAGTRVYSYVAPNGYLCTFGIDPPGTTQLGGGGCTDPPSAAIYGSGYTRDAIDLHRTNTEVLLVPNGVRRARFAKAHGASVAVAVVNNVASYTSAHSFQSSFVNPSGRKILGVKVAASGPPMKPIAAPQR
jgi:hypothetical protein